MRFRPRDFSSDNQPPEETAMTRKAIRQSRLASIPLLGLCLAAATLLAADPVKFRTDDGADKSLPLVRVGGRSVPASQLRTCDIRGTNRG